MVLSRLDFLFQMNPGEPAKALENIASGGEIGPYNACNEDNFH